MLEKKTSQAKPDEKMEVKQNQQNLFSGQENITSTASSNQELEDKITPVIDEMMKKVMGVKLEELGKDISDKLLKRPFFHFEADITISFPKAKRAFKRAYLLQLLRRNYGNISEVAKLAGLNRRSIHRLVKPSEVDKIRKDLPHPLYVKKEYLVGAIEDVLGNYKSIIHPKMLKEVYRSVPGISEDLLKALPEKPMTLDEAEQEFERDYLKKALEENKYNLKKTAAKSKLRYETLLRKIKKLNIVLKK